MSKSTCLPIYLLIVLLLVTSTAYSAPPTAPKPLRRPELIALVAGQALPANIVHAIKVRGLSFHPTDEYRAQLKTAGADASVIAALNQAKAPDSPSPQDKWERELVQHLTNAGDRIRNNHFDDAVGDLTAALTASVDVPEAGFVMGGILRQKEEWPQAAAVYTEVLREDPNFPEAHTKLSFILYRLSNFDAALREAKLVIAENPDNAEAHKNLGLALFGSGKSEAAMGEYREALRLKPDYSAVHYNLGLLFDRQRDPQNAIAEFRKAVKFDPTVTSYHYNLGTALGENGDPDGAIAELREAKRLDPTKPEIRLNLAANLEHRDMNAAVKEFLELEKIAPNFQVCQKCLASALHVTGDDKAALERYRRAAELDPYDPDVPLQLGGIFEEQKNYDGALAQFRKAEQIADNYGAAHLAVGRVLLAKKEYASALQELKKAAALAPADAPTQDMLARALRDSGDIQGAMTAFKEAQALDPKLSSAMLGLAQIFEAKGDWPHAIDLYKRAALADAAYNSATHNFEAYRSHDDAQPQYRLAQARLDEHIRTLKAAGKAKEVADLEAALTVAEAGADVSIQLQQLVQAGDEARNQRRFPEAEISYRKAIELAEKSAPNDDLLITALEHLGGVYGFRQNFSAADETLHRALALIAKKFGPSSDRAVDTLGLLVGNSVAQKDLAAAENYALRAVQLSEKQPGETTPVLANSLRMIASLYTMEKSFDKAKPYLVRATDMSEKLYGAQDYRAVMPLYALCSVEDHTDGPAITEACYSRLLAAMETIYGPSHPAMLEPLNGYAKSLRGLGRTDEATKVEQRVESIKTVAQQK